jgi:hypothetical protein
MWSTTGLAAAKALRFGGSIAVNKPVWMTSRALSSRQVITFPTASLLIRRGYFATGGQLAAEDTAATGTEGGKPAKKPAAKEGSAKKPRPAKKELTEEEKEKAEIRQLKKLALFTEPARLPDKAWLVYVSQHLKGNKTESIDLGPAVKQLSQAYQSLSSSEREV